ncbi:ABC transporter substrate-binding protein [Alsobacter sp. SYSU M60028]|uniref:ABC transporter substrate-binding protein n=1 Tax=Alsobacter ponti TaxID=2962936 RepID=A0ABT1LH23_9HYPH|nr:ABC transporter substrate-binding protein [Alsobacter ponti]MCP8940799.1 ABC transporter substrate-binding protein [Alsobacter ponti]
MFRAALLGTLVAGFAGAAAAQSLRVGLAEDPDVLDPHQARTFVGRIVFTALCDKLVDITPELQFVPRLATSWEWGPDTKSLTFKLREGVKFHDGEPFNAEAVKFNIERAKTLPESRRKSEITSVASVDVVDPMTVRLNLSQPDVTVLAQLSDRAGMMLSPKAAAAAGANAGAKPVCSGPYKFVERVQNDRIVLERFPDHWNKGQYAFEKITYLPIPDSTVRLANLRSGDLDIIERLEPTDVKTAKGDANLKTASAVGLGYQGLNINVANGERAKNPLGQDKRVRQALEASIDRDAINQVVFEGQFTPGNQFFPPNNPYFAKDIPIGARDVKKAQALLKEAGVKTPVAVEVTMSNSPRSLAIMQVIQSMANEAGFDVKLKSTEFATMLNEGTKGDFQANQYGWSGRPDPDGNIHAFVTCKGGLNDWKYCNPEVDKLLDQARTVADPAKRKELYTAAQKILHEDLPIIHLYHESWIWGMKKKLEGFTPHPDGMIRLENVKMAS